MEKYKKIGLKLLYPHTALLIPLIIISISLLVWSMVVLGTTHFVSIISYVLSAYTLTTVCFRIPNIISFIKKITDENKYIIKLKTDRHLRIKITLSATFIYNFIYAIFQFFIGLYHGSLWFYSMFAYYLSLAIMRFFLVRHTLSFKPNEKPRNELLKYRFCGWMMLFLNLALSVMIFFMVYWNRTFNHHEITTIALATYTFTTFTIAIVNFIKYRKYKSPVYSAAKSISLTSACVSIITLETTMFTSFGNDLDIITRRIILGLTGAAVSIFVLMVAINIIVNGNKKLKEIKLDNEYLEVNEEDEHNGSCECN